MNKKFYIGLLCVIFNTVLYIYWFDFLVFFFVKSLSEFTKSIYSGIKHIGYT